MGSKTKANRNREPMTAEQALAATLPKGTVLPTKEWLERYTHTAHSPTNASGQKVGRATLREPWFESLVRRDWKESATEKRAPVFTVEHLLALRIYRNQFEAANRSEVRSCLNVSNGGRSSGGGKAEPTLSVLAAKRWLGIVEPQIGAILDTLRAVAIDDKPYQQVAMDRFGSRAQDIYDDKSGTFTVRFVPRSGRHPTLIREEFIAAVRKLGAAVSGQRQAANSDGPSAAEMPKPNERVTDALTTAIEKRVTEGRPVGSIIIAQATVEAIMREGEESVLTVRAETVEVDQFCGIPLVIRDDWPWGWVLNDVEGQDA